MSERITLRGLVGLLVQRKQMQEADAEAFVNTLSTLLEEALVADRYLKIKKFGTFKLIDTEEGRDTLSFVPDKILSDAVNKPFSQFETVLLKDDVHFDDMPEPQEENEGSQAVPLETFHAAGGRNEEEQPRKTKEEWNMPGEQTDVLGRSGEMDARSQLRRFPWCAIASILFAGILMGGVIVWSVVSDRPYIPEPVMKYLETQSVGNVEEKGEDLSGEQTGHSIAVADTSGLSGSVAETVPTDTVKAVLREGQEASGNRQVLTDAVRYGIKGTLATHILRRGESLARLAQKYYGNKKLWPYLARYNRKRISDVDNVPVGTVILIPELVPEK